MTAGKGTLHLVCGKIASGKSTRIAELGLEPNTIVLSEDEWLSKLYGDDMCSVADYVRYSARLRGAVGPHVVALLNAGLSVALDFPANTREVRTWMRSLFEEAGATHKLYFFDVPDEVCLARLRTRNEAGDHAFAATEAQFVQISKHFAPPAPEEGFDVVICGP